MYVLQKAERMDLGDAVIVDADKNTVSSEYDDVGNLPDEMVSDEEHLDWRNVPHYAVL